MPKCAYNVDDHRLCATQHIHAGELIITEEPILKLDISLKMIFDDEEFYHRTAKFSGCAAIEQEIAALPRRQGRKFAALFNSRPEEEDVGKFRTNAFSVEEKRGPQMYHKTVVYNLMSRANHSCRPNATMEWNQAAGTGSLYALQSIPTNTPIVLNYLGFGGLAPAWQRRKDLRKHYKFDCDCQSCNLHGHELIADNTARQRARAQFYELEDSENQMQNPRALATLVTAATRYIDYLQQLNINDGRLAYGYNKLAELREQQAEDADEDIMHGLQHCNDCHANGGVMRHLIQAREAWNECQEIDQLTHGPDHPQLEVTRKALEKVHRLISRLKWG